jgi:hypothetical protein
MIQTVVFDTKPYDREPLQRASAGLDIEWRFMDCRLSADTATAAQGAQAVCTFVNDRVDRPCLEALARLGVKHILSKPYTTPELLKMLKQVSKLLTVQGWVLWVLVNHLY